MNRTTIGLVCFLCSVAAHASILLKRSDAHISAPPPPRPSVVQLSVTPVERPTPPVESASPSEVAPAPKPLSAPRTKRVPVTPAPDATLEPAAEHLEEPPAADSPPPGLTGTTLVNDLGDGWSAPEGNGGARRGAIRAGLPSALDRPTAPSRHATGIPRAIPPPATTPFAELSQKPVPPSLTSSLERNYPLEARRQGKAGEAKVRARVDPSGHVSLAKVVFESAGGFGSACQKTLLESTWTPPLDRQGKVTATWVTYRCKFRIDD